MCVFKTAIGKMEIGVKMANSIKTRENCGPVIACGAASVSFDHKPGEPTSIDNFAAAVKRLFKGERRVASTSSRKDGVGTPHKAAV